MAGFGACWCMMSLVFFGDSFIPRTYPDFAYAMRLLAITNSIGSVGVCALFWLGDERIVGLLDRAWSAQLGAGCTTVGAVVCYLGLSLGMFLPWMCLTVVGALVLTVGIQVLILRWMLVLSKTNHIAVTALLAAGMLVAGLGYLAIAVLPDGLPQMIVVLLGLASGWLGAHEHSKHPDADKAKTFVMKVPPKRLAGLFAAFFLYAFVTAVLQTEFSEQGPSSFSASRYRRGCGRESGGLRSNRERGKSYCYRQELYIPLWRQRVRFCKFPISN